MEPDFASRKEKMTERLGTQTPRAGTRRWRSNAVWLFSFLLVLTLEAAFNVGILLGRYRWKNDAGWVQPVFLMMSFTLVIMLWALYRQAGILMRGYLAAAEDA